MEKRNRIKILNPLFSAAGEVERGRNQTGLRRIRTSRDMVLEPNLTSKRVSKNNFTLKSTNKLTKRIKGMSQ